jgi:hypothetical protein
MSELFASVRSETRARQANDLRLADDLTGQRAFTEQRCTWVGSSCTMTPSEQDDLTLPRCAWLHAN